MSTFSHFWQRHPKFVDFLYCLFHLTQKKTAVNPKLAFMCKTEVCTNLLKKLRPNKWPRFHINYKISHVQKRHHSLASLGLINHCLFSFTYRWGIHAARFRGKKERIVRAYVQSRAFPKIKVRSPKMQGGWVAQERKGTSTIKWNPPALPLEALLEDRNGHTKT